MDIRSLAQFFQTNHNIVYFVYGEAFFVLGLAIALQSRKHSQLALARRLWLLAVFGIVHGIYEWGSVFIPIQRTYLPAGATSVLQLFQLVLGAVSFLALFQFGVELLVIRSQRYPWLSMLPSVLFVMWAMGILLAESRIRITLDQIIVWGEVLARYGLAVPGALAAALGLWRQARQLLLMDLPRISGYLRMAGSAFVAYAGLSLITPRADFFPANILNYDMVLGTIGIPVPVFRAVTGAAIAYLIIRGSEIFDVETDRLLEEVAQARAVATDRERIGRELHDSIIQSLYAAGLMLEDASLTIDEDPGVAKQSIQGVTAALNRTIRDIRRYVLDLRGEGNVGDWQTGLAELVRAFRLETLIDADFQVVGTRRAVFASEEGSQVLAIAREALNNISKHSQATRVNVTLEYRPSEMELDIVDNGIGFSHDVRDDGHEGEHQGLRNMQERATIIGANLLIESDPGRGTSIRLRVPSERVPFDREG